MFRSTLFTLAISALAAMALAAPSSVKRHNDDNDNVLGINDVGLVNVDEALKDADVLNGLNLLSNVDEDHHYHGHDHGRYHDHDFDHFGKHLDHYDDHDHYGYHGDWDGDRDEYT